MLFQRSLVALERGTLQLSALIRFDILVNSNLLFSFLSFFFFFFELIWIPVSINSLRQIIPPQRPLIITELIIYFSCWMKYWLRLIRIFPEILFEKDYPSWIDCNFIFITFEANDSSPFDIEYNVNEGTRYQKIISSRR